MSDVDLPDGFREHEKTHARGDTPNYPAISWRPEEGNLNILKYARECIGDPDYVRMFWKESQLAIVPTRGDHDNAYSVTESNVSAGWVERELGRDIPAGRYRAEDGGGVLIVDFAEGPLETND